MTDELVERDLICGSGDLLPPPSARSLLLTIVGEMLDDTERGAWTAALLRVLRGLGVEDHAARQTLARAAEAGWLERERRGRSVSWRLAPRGRQLVEEGKRRSAAYLSAADGWNGEWLVLHVSVPHQMRTIRKRLYGGLAWLGMGSVMPAVWVSPHAEREPELRQLVSDLALETTAFAVRGAISGIGMEATEIVSRAWDLADLESRYGRFLGLVNIAVPPVSPEAVMLSYLDLLNVQQRFMRLDPMLPAELLPDWIGRQAAAVFARVRAERGAVAHDQFQRIASEVAPR